ncbi:GmrSD restriction endonuclease domain-containing protein [Dactylosporangium sp. CA-092794]|uniref:GmrSD restriction endonuclease domain-containing protein n=1 Tax=Dactylosporangium sp. CA-092794 TaxID=3239929 RepID=UPI003D925E1B
MHIDQATLQVGELMRQISRTEIRLPELQRSYVWRPTQVAKLVDSLYRGFPFGSLLFWQSDETPVTRAMAVGGTAEQPFKPPLYLLDGQQRLTSLHRVFHDHPDAQIVFHVEKDRFQNQSAATRADPNWIKVHTLLHGDRALFSMIGDLRAAGCRLPDLEIERRLTAVRSLAARAFHVEILRDCGYLEVSEVFVRVNSAGRHLSRADLAMSTLSAKWPGVLDKFQKEAAHWRAAGYADLDVDFLTRAFAGVLFGGGMSSWSVNDLSRVAEADLVRSWDVVQRGLRHLVKLLKDNLRLPRSEPLPSLAVLIPLIVLLGEHSGPTDKQTADALLYWLLIATVRARYSTSSDTNLTRDIAAARKPDPARELLHNLGVLQALPSITAESLAGRSKESPYFFLSLLVAQRNGARDWWYATGIMPGDSGDHQLQYHHVHPVATLERYDKGEINDLANLAFISRKANLKISDKSPAVYFPAIDRQELAAHYIPLDEELRAAEAFPRFLAARRALLAAAMTQLLTSFRPAWLDALPSGPAATSDGYKLTMVLYGSAWIRGRLVLRARGAGVEWIGSADMDEFADAIEAAAKEGRDGDVEISGESVPVQVIEDAIEVPIGPFTVSGTAQEWLDIIARERAAMQAPGRMPAFDEKPWAGERIPLPAGSTD